MAMPLSVVIPLNDLNGARSGTSTDVDSGVINDDV